MPKWCPGVFLIPTQHWYIHPPPPSPPTPHPQEKKREDASLHDATSLWLHGNRYLLMNTYSHNSYWGGFRVWPITGTDQPEAVIFFLSDFWNICYPGTSLEDFHPHHDPNLSYIQSNFSIVARDAPRPLTNPFSCHRYAYKAILVFSPKMLWGHLQTRFHATGTLTSHFSVVAEDALRPLTIRCSRQGYNYLSHPKFCRTCHFCIVIGGALT
jgi:hypothetical protein